MDPSSASDTELGHFPCSSCSACCLTIELLVTQGRSADPSSVIYKAAKEFPYAWDESGCCEKLKEGLCEVYEDRPLFCNVKSICKAISEETGVSVKELYSVNASMCNVLIDSLGLDKRFMIDPDQFA